MDAAIVGSYVASAVALAVGIITPWRTNASAARRQREQLAHDRAMRRRDEIIAVIGEATSAGATRLYVTDRARDLWQQAVPWDDEQAQAIERDRVVAVERLRDAWGRVEMRFPGDADVRLRFEDWRAGLDAYSMVVRFGHRSGRPYAPEMVKVEEHHDATAEAADRWLEAARAAVVALDRGESPTAV